MAELTSNNKRIAKNAALLYIRMAVVMVLNLYISRVVLKALGVEDFGIYNVVGGVVALFSYLNSALTAGTQRFLNFEMGRSNSAGLNKVFSMSLNIHLILAIVFLVLSETVGLWFMNTQLVIPEDRLLVSNWVYQFSILTTIFQIITIPYSALITAHEEMSAYAYISMGEVFLKLGGVLLLAFLPYDNLAEYAVVMFLVLSLARLAYVFYAKRRYSESCYKRIWDSALFKEMFHFIGWNFMGATAGVAMNQGVNILLNIFFGPVVNASRSIAVQVQQAFAQLATNFTTAVNPQIVKSFSAGEQERMVSLVVASSKYAFLIMAVTCMPFLVKMDFVLQLWLAQVPEHAVSFCQLLLLYQLTICLTYSLNMSSQATGNIKLFQIVESSAQFLILPLGWLQLKMGMTAESVFITMIVLSSVALILRLLVLKKIMNFNIGQYIRSCLIPVLYVRVCLAVIYILSIYFFVEDLGILGNLAYMFLILCLSCSIVYFLGLTINERSLLKGIILKVLNKIRI